MAAGISLALVNNRGSSARQTRQLCRQSNIQLRPVPSTPVRVTSAYLAIGARSMGWASTSSSQGAASTAARNCSTSLAGVSSHNSAQLPQDDVDASSKADNTVWTVHAATGWTAKQQHHVLTHGRNWQAVERFWEQVVCGRVTLADLHPSVAPAEQYLPDMTPYASPFLSHNFMQGHHDGTQCNTRPGLVQADQPASRQLSLPDDHSSEASDGTHSVPASAPLKPSRKKKTDRCTYKVAVAYYGPAFQGWAYNPALPDQHSVEGALCRALQPLVAPTSKANVSGAGRTDRNVSAAGQVFSFYSWNQLRQDEIAAAIHSAPHVQRGTLRMLASCQQPRSFHANFSATWRRYIYLMPLRSTGGHHSPHTVNSCTSHLTEHTVAAARSELSSQNSGQNNGQNSSQNSGQSNGQNSSQNSGQSNGQASDWNSSHSSHCSSDDNSTTGSQEDGLYQKAAGMLLQDAVQMADLDTCDVDPRVVHQLLQPLVGKPLDFFAFARDTPKGKDTVCQLHVARATRVQLPHTCSVPNAQDGPQYALCVELVADRFLRRMVRVLVSTAVMEALAVQSTQTAQQQLQGTATPGAHCHADIVNQQQQQDEGAVAPLIVHQQGMLRYCSEGMSRTATCIPATAEGLCFAGVGYGDVTPV